MLSFCAHKNFKKFFLLLQIMNPENKICFFINWLRELDMYEETYKNLPPDNIFFIINNQNKSKRSNMKEVERIKKYFKDNSIRNYELLSEFKSENKFKVLISTADLPVSFLSIKSILRFIYAQTVGSIIQFLRLDVLCKNFFDRDITCEGRNSDIFDNKYIEKRLSKKTIKFPNGLDRNTFYFPDKRWKDVFDIYFCSSKIEDNLIKKKFKNIETFFIGYPRFDLKKHSNKNRVLFNKEFNFIKDKKKIVCLPNERVMTSQNFKAIQRYIEVLSTLSNEYNLILRPHPKLQDINYEFYQMIKKSGLKLDLVIHRNIFDLLSESDLILADYGNIVLESIYLRKKIIIYEWPNEKKFRILNDKKNCLDFSVRKNLEIIDFSEPKKYLSKIHNLIANDTYQNSIVKYSEELFNEKKNKKDLNNLLKEIYAT